MGPIAVQVLTALLEVVARAFRGDGRAQEQLRAVLPARLHTDMVAEAQDALDREKFGARDDHTQPTRRP